MRDRRIFTPLTVLLKKSTPRSRSIEADTTNFQRPFADMTLAECYKFAPS
jgi:hypothetical protein